ncbi:MAG: hypothetical protein AAF492_21555 [Verrucomicrobiota bacterium]
MKEICLLLIDDRLLRCTFGTATTVPDSRERWEAIWTYRHAITDIVHTHPGNFLGFSEEDRTTMQAVEAGTGQRYTWSIVTLSGYLSKRDEHQFLNRSRPWWLAPLRLLSFGPTQEERKENEHVRIDQPDLARSKR